MQPKFLLKNKIRQIPKSIGVYFLSNGENVLYIGKSANIRERVKNHFQQPTYQDNLFIGQVNKVGYIKTDSEIEALILEANLIKKFKPKYNVAWRDDKNYFYLGVTKESLPKIFITHQIKIKNQKSKVKNTFIGPFVDGSALKQTLKILRKVFPYRSCNNIPKRPCLWYQINRCPAPCLLKSNLGKQLPNANIEIKNELKKNIKNIIKILRGGGKKQVLKDLYKEMKLTSRAQNFEKAAKIRNKINALENVLAHAKIFTSFLIPDEENWLKTEEGLRKNLGMTEKISRIEAYDVSNIRGKEATGSMTTFINGLPNKNFYRKFKIKYTNSARPTKGPQGENTRMRIKKPNDVAMIKEILIRRLKHGEWRLPDLILIDGGKAQLNIVIKSKFQNPNSKNIKVMALAKKENKLFIEGKKEPILLKKLPREISNLILRLRDESHRFAIFYHKNLRLRTLFSRNTRK